MIGKPRRGDNHERETSSHRIGPYTGRARYTGRCRHAGRGRDLRGGDLVRTVRECGGPGAGRGLGGCRRLHGRDPGDGAEARTTHAGRGYRRDRDQRRADADAGVHERPGDHGARAGGEHRPAERRGELRHRHSGRRQQRLHHQRREPDRGLRRRGVRQPDVGGRVHALRHGARGNPARSARHPVRPQRNRRARAVRVGQARRRIRGIRHGDVRGVRPGALPGRRQPADGGSVRRPHLGGFAPAGRLRRQPPRPGPEAERRQRLRGPRPNCGGTAMRGTSWSTCARRGRTSAPASSSMSRRWSRDGSRADRANPFLLDAAGQPGVPRRRRGQLRRGLRLRGPQRADHPRDSP